MNQLLQQLQNEPFTLLVSLPRNDVRLAEAALRGGAQGLKVHLNVEHFASGTRFGSFEEEHENIARIVEVASTHHASVGIVPGGSSFATEEEFQKLAQLGIDFFDAYPSEAPPWTLTQKHLDVMLAAYAGGSVRNYARTRTRRDADVRSQLHTARGIRPVANGARHRTLSRTG
jgi:hypothetical protein